MERRLKFIVTALGFFICSTFFVSNIRMRTLNNVTAVVNNNYDRALHEASNYMHDVDNLLAKVRLAREPKQNIALFAEIWKQACSAHDNLSALPYTHDSIANAMKYLSQTSDFAYAMMNKSIDDEEISNEEWKQLAGLRKHAKDLSEELNLVLSSNTSVVTAWNQIPNINSAPDSVSKQFQDYSALIYDGPFSEHLVNMKPTFLEDKKFINTQEALAIAKRVLKRDDVVYSGESTARKSMPVLSFTADNDQTYIELTKQGGLPVLMLTPYETASDIKITTGQAINIASDFLIANGFKNMKDNYYEQFENTITINFAYMQDNVTIYPDLIKTKVNLSTGKVIGLETTGYLMRHKQREISVPKLSYEQACDLISPQFKIKKLREVVIPLDSGQEAHCYEFNGTLDADEFMIYVNADTGKYENILQLITNTRGTLSE